jgi:hypothetical protein
MRVRLFSSALIFARASIIAIADFEGRRGVRS